MNTWAIEAAAIGVPLLIFLFWMIHEEVRQQHAERVGRAERQAAQDRLGAVK